MSIGPNTLKNFRDAVILFHRSRLKPAPYKLLGTKEDIQVRKKFERRRVLKKIADGEKLTRQDERYAKRRFGIIFIHNAQFLGRKNLKS